MNTHVKESEIHGYGLFASRMLARGEEVVVFEGRPSTTWSPYLIDLGYTMIEVVGDAKYVNHSTTPNTDMAHNTLIATRDIEVDEEITFDYGYDTKDL